MKTAKRPVCFILLAGAGLRASIWDRLRPRLQGSCWPLEVEASGEARGSLLYLQEYVSQFAGMITKIPEQEWIVVGHSSGGLLGTQLLGHPDVKGRVRGFVAIASILPLAGQSFVRALPWPMRWIMPILLQTLGTKPPDAVILNDLCRDLAPADKENILQNFQREPRCLYTDACHSWQVPEHRLYIRLRDDRAVSPRQQAIMQQRLEPCMSEELPTGHLPMLQNPEALAELLNRFAAPISMS